MKKIIIVLGMHRSGTSALAGLLHSNGIVMGNEKKKDFYPPPMKENPKGFFENVRFRRKNDLILGRNGYKVKSFDPYCRTVQYIDKHDQLYRDMRELVYEFNKDNEVWGWKDPRTNLTLINWIRVFDDLGMINNLKLIYINRDHEEIAESMRLRGNKEKDPGQFVALSDMYQEKCMVQHEVHYPTVPFLTIEFDDLLYSTDKTIERMGRYLNFPLVNNGFIDPKIPMTEGTK